VSELERLMLLGPRPPRDLTPRERWRYRLPALLLGGAALLLLVSIFLPYWQLTLFAPQYPGGLEVEAYVNRLSGDVAEIDGLNHYIGMRPLGEAAVLERTLSVVMIAGVALLTLAAIVVHTPWALALSLPALAYPAVFLADLYFWLRNFGTNLDPRAPLSNAVDPFVPPVLGWGHVGQFKTLALPGAGLYLALGASALIVAGLVFHRRAYKPLLERLAREGLEDAPAGAGEKEPR